MAIMDVVRNMMLKKMLVFSGADKRTTNKFQLGAVGIAETMDIGCRASFKYLEKMLQKE